MSDTTITISAGVKERLTEYRDSTHGSWDETLSSLMNIVPTTEEFREGCIVCGCAPNEKTQIDTFTSIVQSFTESYGDDVLHTVNLYCSLDCAREMAEIRDRDIPKEPESVVIGGANEFRTEIEDSLLFVRENGLEVTLPLPGAFSGTSEGGHEYAYIGEPVYVFNEGGYRQSGIIEDIIHEEGQTTLLLKSKNLEFLDEHHPEQSESSNVAEN